MTIQTIQDYALNKGTSQQNVRQSKKIEKITLPLFVRFEDKEIEVGKQTFVIVTKI